MRKMVPVIKFNLLSCTLTMHCESYKVIQKVGEKYKLLQKKTLLENWRMDKAGI